MRYVKERDGEGRKEPSGGLIEDLMGGDRSATISILIRVGYGTFLSLVHTSGRAFAPVEKD